VLDHLAMAVDLLLYGPDALPLMNRGPLNVLLGYALSFVCLAASWT
jgi:hypothetical protein